MELPHLSGARGVRRNRQSARSLPWRSWRWLSRDCAFGAGQASANHVSCGDEITADTTLDSDLVNCENNGILIGADDITLDLNGHRIDGDGTEAPGCDPNTGALRPRDRQRGPRRGHRARRVGARVWVRVCPGARENRVLNISASSHDFFGAVFGGSSRSVIRGGSFSRNIAPEGDGIGLFCSDHIRIVGNEIRRNPGPGIHVFDSTENLIKGNRFSRNDIFMEGDRNRVTRNRSVRADVGIMVSQGNRNVIARNRIFRAVGGILIDSARGNLVAGNVIVRARRDGIPLFSGGNNIIRRNRVRGSGDDGIWVNQENDRILLRRNVAVGTGDDGFDVDSRSTKLTRNRAVRNGDLGIQAVEGVIDGGGNRASGNGDPRQCVNVTCH